MRAELLRAGAVYEGVVTIEELRRALQAGRRLIAFNAVRGVYRLRVEESVAPYAAARVAPPAQHSRL